MAFDNNLTGILFPAKDGADPKHGTHSGSCEVDHVKFWLSGWRQADKTINLQATPQDKAAEVVPGSGNIHQSGEEWTGSITFPDWKYEISAKIATTGQKSKVPGTKYLKLTFRTKGVGETGAVNSDIDF